MAGKDVFVSYHSDDEKIAEKLANAIASSGMSVFCPGADVPSAETTKGLINCKMFVSVLSNSSVSERRIHDQLSLAYISNKPIFPVGLAKFGQLAERMNGGLRLMVAKINWVFILESSQFKESAENLITALQANAAQEEGDELTEETNLMQGYYSLNRGQEASGIEEELSLPDVTDDFWQRHFGDVESVEFNQFNMKFIEDYRGAVESLFQQDSQRVQFMTLIRRDVFEQNPVCHRSLYRNFCGADKSLSAHTFFLRIRDYAIGSFAIREVFDMDSTVRYTAVENLIQYQTRGVLQSLMDLLRDEDPNLRAIAAVSLGRTGKAHKQIVRELVRLLDDPDRLVRESACLSLGHLKARAYVPNLLDRWRNDPISHVREAAQVALRILGGDEADQAMKVLGVLTKEVQALKAH